MPTQTDAAFMVRAIELSKQGYPAPNPHVGCVIVQKGQIVGEGFHDHAGGPHAEIEALSQAGSKAKGGTAFVTLEPCNHQGRTGPCSLALIEAGIARVVYAVPDPNPRAQGGGAKLAEAGLAVESGLLHDEAESANELWALSMQRRRVSVVVKAAITRNEMIAQSDGTSKWITGIEGRTEAHRLRAECGAVLVGRGTVEADNPELTVRHIKVVNQPVRIVLDADRKLSDAYRVFDRTAPTLRIVAGHPGQDELRVSKSQSGFDVEELLSKLFDLGITSLLVEGGASVIESFLNSGVVDRIELFVAKKDFASGLFWAGKMTNPLSDWRHVSTRQLGEDTWESYRPMAP